MEEGVSYDFYCDSCKGIFGSELLVPFNVIDRVIAFFNIVIFYEVFLKVLFKGKISKKKEKKTNKQKQTKNTQKNRRTNETKKKKERKAKRDVTIL